MKRTMVMVLVVEETDELTIDTEGAAVDEPSRIVRAAKPVLAKCGELLEQQRKAAGK
jgi:DNA-directed RNA polymerase subunit L